MTRLSFNVHFLGQSRFTMYQNVSILNFIETKDDGVVMTTKAIRCAKLQSNRHHQQTNTQLLQARCPSCRPNNRVKAKKGIKTDIENLEY